MKKVIGTAIGALLALVGCTSSSTSEITPLDTEQAHHALALMQPPPPLERSGRNMWAALITFGLPNLSPEQRQTLADDYTEAFNHWYTHDYVNWYLDQDPFQLVSSKDASSEPTPPHAPYWPNVRLVSNLNDNALCNNAAMAMTDCLNRVRQQPQATLQALTPYGEWLEQLAALADYDYYHAPLLPHFNAPAPPFSSLRLPLSAHVLTHINGNSEQALAGLCRDTNTARILIRDSNNLITLMVGASFLRGNLMTAAQIIAELPLDTALPASCDTAFAPLTAEEINQSLCSAMRGEHANLRSFIELQKKQLVSSQTLSENEKLSYLDNVFLVDAQQKAVVCGPQIQQPLREDAKFATPTGALSAWPQQCQSRIRKNKSTAYGVACALAQTSTNDSDRFDDYVHRMQDMTAQLQMMQVLLWLRQQPNLPQPLTSHYLQTAVPANIYASTHRPLALSEDGSELQIAVYEKRPHDPCKCVRLPLPHALRDATE